VPSCKHEGQSRYKFRLYPNQEQALARQFGACRFVYNHFLRACIDYYAANKGGNGKKGPNYSKRGKQSFTKFSGADAPAFRHGEEAPGRRKVAFPSRLKPCRFALDDLL
jgi:transposase